MLLDESEYNSFLLMKPACKKGPLATIEQLIDRSWQFGLMKCFDG
jgi:hypothetical protein